MDIIIWVAIMALFVLSFIGLIFPIIPSVLVLWIAFHYTPLHLVRSHSGSGSELDC